MSSSEGKSTASLLLLLSIALGIIGSCSGANAQGAAAARTTRVVLRFGERDDLKALDRACTVLRERLKQLEAADISVTFSTGREVVAEFRAPKNARLDKDSELIRALSQRGGLCFYIGAKESEFTAKQKDMHVERKIAVDWLTKPENANESIDTFNALPEDKGGPTAGFRWYPMRNEEGKPKLPREDTVIALVVPKKEWTFTGADLEHVSRSVDRFGFPAVSFQMKPASVIPFGDFTEAHVNQAMVIVLGDEIVSYANIGERLPGQAQIYGRFDEPTIQRMIVALRSGELPSKPVLVSVEQVD